MPRLQVLELPTEHHGDDMMTPFILILDGLTQEQYARYKDGEDIGLAGLGGQTGAHAVIAFPFRVDLPANDPLTDPR